MFQYCSGLSSIIIPPSVNNLYSNTFRNCAKLSLVIFLGESISGSSYSFYNCINLKEVHVLPSYSYDSFCGKNVIRCIKMADAELLQHTFLIIVQALCLYQGRELCLIIQMNLLHGLLKVK